MLYSNLKIFDKHGLFADGSLAVKDGLFALSDEKANDEFAGLYALPGYVDVHTHGALKLDFEDCNVDEALRMLNFYACAGTLYIMPTIGTVEFEHICNAADTILAAAEKIKEEKLDCATVMGIHFECRYLNPVRAGAHAPHLLVAPNCGEADMLIDKVEAASKRLGRHLYVHFTIAPELDGGLEFIKHVKARGATVSIGHSDADAAQAKAAIDAGAVGFTHLFNALRPINHRSSSSIVTALLSDAYTEFICDGKHLLPETVQLIKHSKSYERTVLITDSVAAGLDEGEKFTFLGGTPAHIEGGLAIYDDGRVCGSIMTMQKCVENYIAFTGANMREAAISAVSNPLGMVNADGYARMDVGESANFILVDESFRLRHVFVNGNIIKSYN